MILQNNKAKKNWYIKIINQNSIDVSSASPGQEDKLKKFESKLNFTHPNYDHIELNHFLLFAFCNRQMSL